MWQRVEGYPKQGDYIKVEYKGKVLEGLLISDKPVRFRTGYVAVQIQTKKGVKKWIPWTSKAKYYKKI